MNINALGLRHCALIFHDLPSKNVLFRDNSRVRNIYFLTQSHNYINLIPFFFRSSASVSDSESELESELLSELLSSLSTASFFTVINIEL